MIYLVEDDDSIRELVVYTLNNVGLHAKGCSGAEELWKMIEEEPPRLLLLDIMLPGTDGLSILKTVRNEPALKKLPVMMLTAKSTEYDKVVGFDLGADDYMTKPFGMMELVARVKALLRRTSKEEVNDEICQGSLCLSESRHEASFRGEKLHLTLKEFSILALLMKNKDKVFTRDQLLNTIWGYEFDGENRTVDVHIRSLRQKLGEAGDYIETVRGIGYKFGGENA